MRLDLSRRGKLYGRFWASQERPTCYPLSRMIFSRKCSKPIRVRSCFARPKIHKVYPKVFELSAHSLVARYVVVQLLRPERSISARPGSAQAFVLMPKATVHEDRSPDSADINVRFSGKRMVLQSIPNRMRREETADVNFRAGVFTPDVAHGFGLVH